jgi:hypothetical protein
MSSLVLSFKEVKGLCLSEAAAAIGMVLNDKIHKRLTNGHTYLNGLTGVFPNLTATALEYGHFRWPFHHQIPGEWIRNDLFYVLERDIVVQGDYRFGKLRGKYFAVIMTGQPLLSSGPHTRNNMVDEYIDVLLDPTTVDIPMQTAEIEESPQACHLHELPGRGA